MDETDNKQPDRRRDLEQARQELESAERGLKRLRSWRVRYWALQIAVVFAFVSGHILSRTTSFMVYVPMIGFIILAGVVAGLAGLSEHEFERKKLRIAQLEESVERRKERLLPLENASRHAQHGLSVPEESEDDESGHLTVAEGGELSEPE